MDCGYAFPDAVARCTQGVCGGAVIEGKIRRTAAVVVTALLWTAAMLFLTLSLVALKEYAGAGVAAALMVIGLGLMTYDRSESYIRSYLESFKEDK